MTLLEEVPKAAMETILYRLGSIKCERQMSQ